MVKKLSRHGNSYALVLDRGVLDLLKIDQDTPLDISTDGNVIILAPIRDAKRRRQFEASLDRVNKKFGPMLKRLAD